MSATSEQRRAAVVKRIKALGPQPRPVFRSGVDIDAVHYLTCAAFRCPVLGTAIAEAHIGQPPRLWHLVCYSGSQLPAEVDRSPAGA